MKILNSYSNYRIRQFAKFILPVLLMTMMQISESKGSSGTANTGNDNDLITVFLDFSLHQQYVRETITFVNFVRDRELSQLHIMMIRQGSGTTGENYVISFLGRGRFEGMNNFLTYWAPGTNTLDETRRGLVNMLQMGLVPYIAATDMASQISLSIRGERSVQRAPVVDPWKNWVFEIYGGANFFKEERQNRFDARWGFSADKISDDWKIRLRPYFNNNERNFIRPQGTITSRSHRHGFTGDMIRSINQHWSTGLFVRSLSSTFTNMRFNVITSPGIEYSVFPYRESNRRSITFAYMVGMGYHNYIEETIFLVEEEFLGSHSMDISVRFQQPWGSFRASVSGSHYFHDFTSNRIEMSSRLDFRVVRGLSFNISGGFDLINDLVSLPAGDLSLEEILLQQRRQATSYQISGSIGLSYWFGSQYTNVVNTRF
jgi:hypothetical protein